MYIFETVVIRFGLRWNSRRPGDPFRYLYQLLVFLFLTTWHLNGYTQFYEYGQDRGTIRWNQFDSEHYRMIYPSGLDSLAMEFADKLEYYYPHQAAVLDHEHGLMPVVFHNESSFSNGVFVWAPRRLEVFTNPDPNGYPQDWMTQLALHEGRHAVQVSKLNQGLGRALSFIAGEQAVGAITGFLPLWYLEGDAVDAETRFSYTGRGRLPSFEMGMKALLIEKEQRYSFSKALLGSYRDYTPDHYKLGYLMVRYGRRTYGNSFWNDMEDYVARKPYLLAPTYFSMKNYGVRSKQELYNSALDFYEEHWRETHKSRVPDSTRRWSDASDKAYTNYRFPQPAGDTAIIALKTGVDQIPEFIVVGNRGDERRIFRPGFMNSGRFSYHEGLLAWDERVPDVRWSNRNFSVIRLFDMEQKQVRNLGRKTRYYAPAISGSGNRIAVIEQRDDHTFHLVILDLKGRIVRTVGSPEGMFIQHPEWMAEDEAVVVTVNGHDGESLYQYSFRDETWSPLFHAGYHNISFPVVEGDHIYFNSTFSGIDNIYRYSLVDESLLRVTSAAFGAFEPSVSGKQLFFSDYHADGYRAVSKPLSPGNFRKVNPSGFPEEQLDAQPTQREQEIIDGAADAPAGEYSPRPYKKMINAINIHSWLPLYFDYMNPEAALTPEYFPVRAGATILTQNLLSTVTGLVGYEYRNKMHFLHTGLRLKGRLPVFDISLNYGGPPQVYSINHSVPEPPLPGRLTFITNSHIPLQLNTGKYITYIQPLVSYMYTSDIYPNIEQTDYETGNHILYYRLFMSSYLRMGRRDIIPRLGFSAYAGYKHAPFNSHNFGSQGVAGLTLYLPGLLKHQSVRLRLISQGHDPERYLFGNEMPMPRGYKNIAGMEMQLWSADYHFPIVCPDLNIESVVYLKRVRGNLWIDYLKGKQVLVENGFPRWQDRNYTSYGADLLFDFHLLRFFMPLSMGPRVTYLPLTGACVPEFLFTIDLN